MISAGPVTCHPDDTDGCILDYEVVQYGDGSGARVDFRAAPQHGNAYYAIVIDGKADRVVFAPEGEWVSVPVYWHPSVTNHVISIADNGQWPDLLPDMDYAFGQQIFESDKGLGLDVEWDASYVADAYGDSAQLASWSLSGVQRYDNCYRTDISTRCRIDLDMSTAGGTHTVNLRMSGLLVATGSRSGNGSVTLAEQNSSGLSGSVTLTYSADIPEANGAYIEVIFAASYDIYVDDTLELTAADTGRASHFSARIPDISAGNHEVNIKATSDTGVVGSLSGDVGVTVPGRPQPPGAITLQSTGTTNLFYWSEQFNNAIWTRTGTVTANTTTAPDGTVTADTLDGEKNQAFGTLSASTQYAVSIYAKANTGTRLTFSMYDGNLFRNVRFDYSPKTWSSSGGTMTWDGGSYDELAGGWFRLKGVFTTSSSPSAGGSWSAIAGGGSSYVWGAQLEQQSSVTAYVKSEGTQGVRPAGGDYSATYIEWVASATAGVSYNVYDAGLTGEAPQLETPTQTISSGTSATLGAVAQQAGYRRVIVTAVNGSGIEDGLNRGLTIEYDSSGAIVPERPNVPDWQFASISGRTLTLNYSYDSSEEKGSATELRLYLVAEGATVDWGTYQTATLSGSGPNYDGTITATAGANGFYSYVVRAATDTDGLSSNTDLDGPVYLTNASPAAPTPTVYVTT